MNLAVSKSEAEKAKSPYSPPDDVPKFEGVDALATPQESDKLLGFHNPTTCATLTAPVPNGDDGFEPTATAMTSRGLNRFVVLGTVIVCRNGNLTVGAVGARYAPP